MLDETFLERSFDGFTNLTKDETVAFQTCIVAVRSVPILHLHQPNQPNSLDRGTSDYQIASVFLETNVEKFVFSIGSFSKPLQSGELNYLATEKIRCRSLRYPNFLALFIIAILDNLHGSQIFSQASHCDEALKLLNKLASEFIPVHLQH